MVGGIVDEKFDLSSNVYLRCAIAKNSIKSLNFFIYIFLLRNSMYRNQKVINFEV